MDFEGFSDMEPLMPRDEEPIPSTSGWRNICERQNVNKRSRDMCEEPVASDLVNADNQAKRADMKDQEACTRGEMYNMLNAFSERLMAVVDGKLGGVNDGGGSHDCVAEGVNSDYVLGTQVGETDEGEDPLSGLFSPPELGSDPEVKDNSNFVQTIEDLAAIFHDDDEVDVALPEALAKALNTTLRKRPVDEKVKSLASKIKTPVNVQNFKVPVMNDDVLRAMTGPAKLIDRYIVGTTKLINKAMVPLVNVIKDCSLSQDAPMRKYSESVGTSLRLLAAASNYQNYLRKILVRNNVRDDNLHTLCTWEYEVGTDELWKLEVTKKCGELARARRIGRPYYGRRFFGGRFRARGYGRGFGGRANDYRPFLGRKFSRGRRPRQ